MTCYTPLSDSGDIRLLVLQPGQRKDPIQCELKHVLRSEQPAYDALSYEWGPEEERPAMRTILLNQTQHPVRKNLGLALHALRLTDVTRLLWVDALCINQGDDLERGYQVAQMGNIYQNAMMVRIWLGQAPRGAEDMITFLENRGRITFLKDPDWQSIQWFATRNATMALLNNSYWERLWIIQEIVLAGEAYIHFGNIVEDWTSSHWALYGNLTSPSLESAPMTGSDLGPTDILLRETLTPFHIMELPVTKILWQRANRWQPEPVANSSLASLMIEHLSARCADTRDKAFGLESLAYQCCQTAVSVDYSVPLCVLSRQVLEHEIQAHKLDPAGIMKSARLISSSLCFRDGLSVKELLVELESGLHGLESAMNYVPSQDR